MILNEIALRRAEFLVSDADRNPANGIYEAIVSFNPLFCFSRLFIPEKRETWLSITLTYCSDCVWERETGHIIHP